MARLDKKQRRERRRSNRYARTPAHASKVRSGFELVLSEAHDASDGVLIRNDEFLSYVAAQLRDVIAPLTNGLIRWNNGKLPDYDANRDKTPSNYAIHHVMEPPAGTDPEYDAARAIVEDEYIQKYWTMTGVKCEAARLLHQHQAVTRLYEATHDENGDRLHPAPSRAEVKRLLSKDDQYLDDELIRNTLERHQRPALPVVRNPRLSFSTGAPLQCGQQVLFSDVLIQHRLCIGARRFDLFYDAGQIHSRYPNITGIALPTFRLTTSDGLVHIDTSATEQVTKAPVGTNHILAVDRNADHDQCIAAVRVSTNGWVSQPMGPSIATQETIRSKQRLLTELDRARASLDEHTIGWKLNQNRNNPEYQAKLQRIHEDIRNKEERLRNLEDAIDQQQANDLRHHLKTDEALATESLNHFKGGSTFRHGQTDDKIQHAMDRDGRQLIKVNPAGTSNKCMCGAKATPNHDHTSTCQSETPHGAPDPNNPNRRLKYQRNRHDWASPIIGVRGLIKAGYNITQADYTNKVPTLQDDQARSQHKVDKRNRKNQRRAAKGKPTRPPKNKPTPKRPPTKPQPPTSPRWAKHNGTGPGNSQAPFETPERTRTWAKLNTTSPSTGIATCHALTRQPGEWLSTQPPNHHGNHHKTANKANKPRKNPD